MPCAACATIIIVPAYFKHMRSAPSGEGIPNALCAVRGGLRAVRGGYPQRAPRPPAPYITTAASSLFTQAGPARPARRERGHAGRLNRRGLRDLPGAGYPSRLQRLGDGAAAADAHVVGVVARTRRPPAAGPGTVAQLELLAGALDRSEPHRPCAANTRHVPGVRHGPSRPARRAVDAARATHRRAGRRIARSAARAGPGSEPWRGTRPARGTE